jgi:hypothetical protein
VTTGLHHNSHHPTISTTSHQNQGREKWESRDVGWDGTFNDHKNTRHDHPLASLRQPTVCMPSRLSVSGKQSGCAICRFRAGIPADAQHTKAPHVDRRSAGRSCSPLHALSDTVQLSLGMVEWGADTPQASCNVQSVRPHTAAFAVLRSHARGCWQWFTSSRTVALVGGCIGGAYSSRPVTRC